MSVELKHQVKKMLVEALKLDVKPEAIDDDAPLFGSGLGLDSLDALQLAVSVEETFGVQIGDEATGKTAFASVAALAAYIQKAKAA
jgi:acyl carrier protein